MVSCELWSARGRQLSRDLGWASGRGGLHLTNEKTSVKIWEQDPQSSLRPGLL